MATSKINDPNMIGGHYFKTDTVNFSNSITFTIANGIRCLCAVLNNTAAGYLGFLYTDNNGSVGVIPIINNGDHITISSTGANSITIANDTARNARVSLMYF